MGTSAYDNIVTAVSGRYGFLNRRVFGWNKPVARNVQLKLDLDNSVAIERNRIRALVPAWGIVGTDPALDTVAFFRLGYELYYTCVLRTAVWIHCAVITNYYRC